MSFIGKEMAYENSLRVLFLEPFVESSSELHTLVSWWKGGKCESNIDVSWKNLPAFIAKKTRPQLPLPVKGQFY